MHKDFEFFSKRLGSDQPYIRLFLIIFVAALFAKGPVIFDGYAIDDYSFMSGTGPDQFATVLSQGRYIPAAMLWGFNILGVSVNDMSFSFGFLTLVFQSAFVVSILRFVGLEASPAAGLVGAIMVAHPYLTEILTFRMSLPAYSAALLFSIIALESGSRLPATWRTRSLAFFATFAMLITYQVFANYIAVAIIFAFIYGQVLHTNKASTINNVYRDRAVSLTIISTIAIIFFVATMRLVNLTGLTFVTGRAGFISFDKISERIEQVLSSFVNIYWSAEPILPKSLKTLVACMLAISLLTIFWRLLRGKGKNSSLSNIFCVFFAFLLLAPISLGVIIPFGDWWPVPRVIAHVAIITGVIFLMADSCTPMSANRFLNRTIFFSRTIILVGFIMLSNQILADQQKINKWDNMMANRVISRLEMNPNFSEVRFVYLEGGSWGFPAGLRTLQGDMNMSAFYASQSKVPLLSAASGYTFKSANGTMVTIGKNYCADKLPWPHIESTTIEKDLAIICLKK